MVSRLWYRLPTPLCLKNAMRSRVTSKTISTLFLDVVMAFAFCTALAGQPLFGSHLARVRPFTTVDDVLDREAQASDPTGIHQFSEDLIGLVVPEQTGNDYLNSFADRLASAEEMAREGKGKLVPETKIVQVFNDTMRKIGAPFKTDEATVMKFREHSIAVPSLPALLTANRNGTNCSPAEAVFLFYMLSWSNGDLPLSVLDFAATLKRMEAQGKAPTRVMGVGPDQPEKSASEMLTAYALRHRRQATVKLFNDLARAFGF
jgi:hypothetical protein